MPDVRIAARFERAAPLTLLCLVLSVSGCATRARQAPPDPSPPRPIDSGARDGPRVEAPRPRADDHPAGALRVEVGPRGSGLIESVALETYVRDVLVGELSIPVTDGALARPAYQVQAIVARTYALAVRGRHRADGFDVCSTTHCQVYVRDRWRGSRWAAEIEEAVTRTRGRYLAVGGRPIEAVFHAHCGGHTSAAADVWRSAGATYLRGVPDAFCVRERAAAWTSTLELGVVQAAMRRSRRTDVGERLDGVQVLRRDAGGRVVEVVLSGDRTPVVTGEDFRLALLAAGGARALPSARFDVERRGTHFVMAGVGSGHGVGLCQVGMIGRLRAGHTPEDVLHAYYRDVEIVGGGT